MIATEAIQLTLLRPFLSLGYAALVILFVQSGRARWLADRLAATGRMAFSNYLGTSIVVTLFFNGYGLGWYGYLQRWQCLIVVVAVWAGRCSPGRNHGSTDSLMARSNGCGAARPAPASSRSSRKEVANASQ